MTSISIVVGDITEQEVDVIVNAANKRCLGGGGVDGAIHAAAGPGLFKECLKLSGCEAGEAKITGAYDLPAKYVIHTVGPIYGAENGREPELLANCYIKSLQLAEQHECKSIAFPALSTGAFGYPKEEAAAIVHKTITDYVKTNDKLDEIRFVLFKPEDKAVYYAYFAGENTEDLSLYM